jgi:hypothetical protein
MLGGSCSPCCDADACVNYSIFAEAETLEASVEYEYSDGIGGEIVSLTDSSQLIDSNSQTFSNSFYQTHTLSRTSVEEFLVTWESQPFMVNGREMRLTCQVNTLPVGLGLQTQALVPENQALWARRSSLEILCVRGRHPAAFLPENLGPTGLPLDRYSGLGHIGIFEQPCGLGAIAAPCHIEEVSSLRLPAFGVTATIETGETFTGALVRAEGSKRIAAAKTCKLRAFWRQIAGLPPRHLSARYQSFVGLLGVYPCPLR